MSARSAGLLVYRFADGGVEVLLGHPGGPFYVGRDRGVWSIPKGLIEPGEEELGAARREFREETGYELSAEMRHLALGEIAQKAGKRVVAWGVAAPGDLDPAELRSETFELEWPRGSGKIEIYPEMDRFSWFGEAAARDRLLPAQVPLLERLLALLD